jgi:F-type H+-transporting ATPase subunit b
MAFNWTTFALEIINFLVLLWILKRFLYRPVLQVLAERRAGIESSMSAARTTAAGAAALQQQYASRLQDWEQEKASARAALTAELAGLRTQQLEQLQHSLETERRHSAARDAHQRELQNRQQAEQANTRARQFACTLLARLAGPELESRLLTLFIEELQALPEEHLQALRASPNNTGAGHVSSAYDLSSVQQQALTDAVTARLGQPVVLSFSTASNLLAGIGLTLGGWQLEFSLAGELRFFPEVTPLAP